MAPLTCFRLGGHLARTPEDLPRMVEAGRVDYMIGDATSAESRLKSVGLEGKVISRTLPFLAPLGRSGRPARTGHRQGPGRT